MAIMILVIAILGVCVGVMIGQSYCVRNLTLNPDHRGVIGPHCLGGKFYYLVPESLWTKKPCTCERDELTSKDLAIGSGQ